MNRRKEDEDYTVQQVLGEWDDKSGELVYKYEFNADTEFGVKKKGSVDYGFRSKEIRSFSANFEFKNLPDGDYIIKLEKVK